MTPVWIPFIVAIPITAYLVSVAGNLIEKRDTQGKECHSTALGGCIMIVGIWLFALLVALVVKP